MNLWVYTVPNLRKKGKINELKGVGGVSDTSKKVRFLKVDSQLEG